MIELRNPATGEQVGSVAEHSPEEVAGLVDRARGAQPAWQALGPSGRARVLLGARRLLVADADRVIRTIMSETGKAWEDAQFSEVFFGCDALGFWARRGPRWLADRRVSSSSPVAFGKRLVVRYEPLGVVGVISPWNYPLALPLADSIPALAAGNAVVLKPSELTPLSALLAAEILEAAGMPPGVFQVATGAGGTGAALVDHVDAVSFTGSVATGRAVAERAARRLIPVSLELGGKDPVIVLGDADLERAANATVYYSMQNAGQTCISIERAYVEDAVYERFVGMVEERVRALRHGDPAGGPGSVDVGAVTSPAQLEKIASHVSSALEGGARALTGGTRSGGDGQFFPPTVLVDVTPDMDCLREETFGPTLPIVRVRDAEEAIALANDSPFGLGATVFTRDAERGEAVARRLEAGNVTVNDPWTYFALLDLPMGGWKDSGVGSRHGPEGIRKYCRQQTIVVARRYLKREPHMYPYRRSVTLGLLRVMRLAFGRRARGRGR